MQNVVRDWTEALWISFANAVGIVLATIPKIIAFLVIITIGWIIASIVTKVVVTLLNAIKFNGLAERSGFASFVSNMGLKSDSVGFIGLIVKWFIRLIVLIAAFDSLGLHQVS